MTCDQFRPGIAAPNRRPIVNIGRRLPLFTELDQKNAATERDDRELTALLFQIGSSDRFRLQPLREAFYRQLVSTSSGVVEMGRFAMGRFLYFRGYNPGVGRTFGEFLVLATTDVRRRFASVTRLKFTLRAWCLGGAVACFAGAQALACYVPSPAHGFIFEDVPINLDAPVIVEVTIVGREANVIDSSGHYQIANGRVDRVVKGQIGEGPLRILTPPRQL